MTSSSRRTGVAGEASPSSSWSTQGSSMTTAISTSLVEYAKAGCDDILMRSHRRRTAAPRQRRIHVLPTVWFRNTWSWSGTRRDRGSREPTEARTTCQLDEPEHGRDGCTAIGGATATVNDRNCSSPRTRPTASGCSATDDGSRYVKDGIQRRRGRRARRRRQSRAHTGPKRPRDYPLMVEAGEARDAAAASHAMPS